MGIAPEWQPINRQAAREALSLVVLHDEHGARIAEPCRSPGEPATGTDPQSRGRSCSRRFIQDRPPKATLVPILAADPAGIEIGACRIVRFN